MEGENGLNDYSFVVEPLAETNFWALWVVLRYIRISNSEKQMSFGSLFCQVSYAVNFLLCRRFHFVAFLNLNMWWYQTGFVET